MTHSDPQLLFHSLTFQMEIKKEGHEFYEILTTYLRGRKDLVATEEEIHAFQRDYNQCQEDAWLVTKCTVNGKVISYCQMLQLHVVGLHLLIVPLLALRPCLNTVIPVFYICTVSFVLPVSQFLCVLQRTNNRYLRNDFNLQFSKGCPEGKLGYFCLLRLVGEQ